MSSQGGGNSSTILCQPQLNHRRGDTLDSGLNGMIKDFSSDNSTATRRDDSLAAASLPITRSLRPQTSSPPQDLTHDLTHDISLLEKTSWDLKALALCAAQKLGKEKCIGICELGRGSHNSLYRLKFSDSTECAASISNSPEKFFSPQIKQSEIATMQYLYSSPLYNIPIPKVYDWDLSFTNPVGAPYILREISPGKNMAEDGRFYRLSTRDKMKVIKELALVQAELSKPSEFTKIGSIYSQKDSTGFYVGEIVSATCMGGDKNGTTCPSKGPYSSMPDLWQARLERETLMAIQNWSSLSSDSAINSESPPSLANPQHFGEILQLLSGLTGLFTPPKELATLCIHHSDLAIRNVLFDDRTLKITGVIDWEFACVVPLAITGRFPNDLGWEGNEFARSLGRLGDNGEVWNHHYYDWTSLEGVSPPPPSRNAALSLLDGEQEDYINNLHTTNMNRYCEDQAGIISALDPPPHTPSPPSPPLPPPPTSRTSQKDLNIRASRLVELFYLRKYYASCVASRDFKLTSLFIDSVAYIKFNELVMGGYEKWFTGVEWIREVFWRLKTLEDSEIENMRRGMMVIKVPENFKAKSDRGVVDLGDWEKRLQEKTFPEKTLPEKTLPEKILP